MLMMSPRQRRQKFLLMPARTTTAFPQRGRDDAVQRRQVFTLVMRSRLSNQQENQATQRKQPLHKNNKSSQHGMLKGLSIPSGYGASRQANRREINCNRLIDRTSNKINKNKLQQSIFVFWFSRSKNKSKRKQIAKANNMRKRPGGHRFHQWLLSRKIANSG